MLGKMMLGCVLLLGWSAFAHAQQPTVDCVPIQGQGWQGCAPMNNPQQTQQPMSPPPVWADRWGAIASAVPPSPPAFGASANMPSEESARADALAKCEATPSAKCGVEVTYHNQCFAETWGEKTPVSDTAATLDEAIKLSMAYCKAQGNTQCIPYYSACSYPVRVQ